MSPKEKRIRVIKYAIKKGPEARFNFQGSVLEYAKWAAEKWNKAHPNDKITTRDVGLTVEIAKKLGDSCFLPKEKVAGLYCLNTYRPSYLSSIRKD